MFRPNLLIEHRRHPRAQLNLPVRLRWLGPLGQVTELAETLGVSRGGLLFYRRDSCPVNTRVWVTFPFRAETAGAQPETPARVVRVKTTPTGGHLVAVAFEEPRRPMHSVGGPNRRTCLSTPLAVPIRVRPNGTPWPEEAMTVDVSEHGLLFQTARQYALSDVVHVT